MNDFKFNADGLIAVIVQEASDAMPGRGRVLMMAWMNRESLEKTLSTGKMHYWSRSRQKLWFKGESSGHTQAVVRWYAASSSKWSKPPAPATPVTRVVSSKVMTWKACRSPSGKSRPSTPAKFTRISRP